jgi:predicted site-specific integrase-resolvase
MHRKAGSLSPSKPPRDPSIDGFCRRWGISRATFNNWDKAGKAPRTVQPVPRGRRTIPEQEEEEWARRHERHA